jgi:hypothetical protein
MEVIQLGTWVGANNPPTIKDCKLRTVKKGLDAF